MDFKTLTIIKYPPATVWRTMQDHLPAIAERVDDVASVDVIAEGHDVAGQWHTVYTWTTAPDLPGVIKGFIRPDMLSWTDTATWDEAAQLCRWQIESHYFRDAMRCSGSTRFEPALGGKGCRLTFAGQLAFAPNSVTGLMGGDLLTKGLQVVIGNVIPASFRKLATAVEEWIRKDEEKCF